MTEERFHAVVVGSGFGGSVMAYRLAEQGRRVCVLERGRAYPPNSFARTPAEVRKNGFWDPDRQLYGLFDVWSFRNQWAIVSSGLGGGSLIYANVLLRMPPEWFTRDGFDPWPVTYHDLAPHYLAVETAMGATRYPQQYAAATDKTVAFRAGAESLAAARPGLKAFEPSLAVTFANAGSPPEPAVELEGGRHNVHRAPRFTCRLCGECDAGCNYGSKNTLDYTYLSMAEDKGATIRPLHEVKGFARDASGGWRVRYVDHSDGCHARPGELRCDRLVLSAGALGTTFLLLRNRAATPEVSPMLGRRFSGNGDYLTFAARSTAPVDPSHGPVITSALAVPDAANGGDGPGFYLEDGGYPAFLAWYWEAAMLPSGLVRLLGRRKTRRLAGYLVRGLLAARFPRVPGNPERNFSGELAALLGSLDPSWVPILGMGRDRADGVLSLGKDGKLDLRRSWAANAPYYHRVEDCSRQLARAMGGTFEPSLLRWFNLAITVHPLGGCPMGVSKTEGVVNPRNGEVWGSPGLHVADGSVLPGPAGANPSLTIAAVAHHFADGILRDG